MPYILRSVTEIERDRSVCHDSVIWVRLTHIFQGSWWWAFTLNMEDVRLAQLLSGNIQVFLGMKAPWLCRLHYWKYQGADKSLVRPGRKQAWKHVRDARDFNKIELRAVIKLFLLQSKAPKEVHAILAETLGCFLPGRAKDLSAPL